MLSVALGTLRNRWVGLAGGFLALALGVGIIAAMLSALAATFDGPEGRPERFAAAPVVVKGADTLRVPTPIGDRVLPLTVPHTVPPALVAQLSALGRTVEDHSFPLAAPGAPPGLVGHPWSTAAFAPYALTAGRAPRAADEVAVSGSWAAPGTRIRTGTGSVLVVGTVSPSGRGPFEDAIFFTDPQAARLAPRVGQLAVAADPAAVRALVGGTPGVHVLTGDARRLADADPEAEHRALAALNVLFGTAAGISGFVAVFVVASTLAFTVAQRRREFGLLRTIGASPGQLRRTVLAESLLAGLPASAAGCLLGRIAAPALARSVVDGGLAPGWYAIGDHRWPYAVAFAAGLTAALCGAAAASWRAGRTAPAEALREAALDGGALTPGRRLLGGALLLTALGLTGYTLLTDPGDLLHRKSCLSRPMLPISACALLAPAPARPLVRLITWLPGRLRGAGGLLVRENALAAVRRTAAVAAPVLVAVALAGSLLGATATMDAAKAAESNRRTTADLVVTAPSGPAGIDAAALRRIRAVAGVAAASAVSRGSVFVVEDGTAVIRSDAWAADAAPLAATTRLPVAAGRLADLDDNSIVVNEEWQRHTVGQEVAVRLGDGTPRTLRIAAVLRTGTGDNGVYVTPHNAPGTTPDQVRIRLARGADPAATAAALRGAVARTAGATVLTRSDWLRAGRPAADRVTRLGYLLVLGIALLYAGLALAGTLATATCDRSRELLLLRLTGATGRQILRLVSAEALATVAVGAVLGLLVTLLDTGCVVAALGVLGVRTPLALPWTILGAVVAGCALAAVVSAALPAALVLRRGAAGAAAERD